MTVGKLKTILNTIDDDIEIKIDFVDNSKTMEYRNCFIKRAEVVYTDTQYVTDEEITLIIRTRN